MIDRSIYCRATRLCSEAPVPIGEIYSIQETMGGAGNVATWLAFQGYYTKLITQFSPSRPLTSCDDFKIVDRKLEVCNAGYNDSITIVKERIYYDDQLMLRIDHENISKQKKIDSKKILQNLPNFKNIIFSDYNKGMNVLLPDIIKNSNEVNSKVFIDCKIPDLSVYSGAYLLKMNKNEFIAACKANNIKLNSFKIELDNIPLVEALIEIKLKFQIEIIIVTDGARGSLGIDVSNTPIQVAAPKIEGKNHSGAGDVFLAAIVHAMSSSSSINEAMSLSNKCAAKSVSSMEKELFKFNYLKEPNNISDDGLVFTNGCFDIIHSGHVDYLKKSRSLGSKLVVGINSDESVRHLKGPKRPINNEQMRKKVLLELECVDEVLIFDEPTPHNLIIALKPKIITKGSDYNKNEVVGHDLVQEWGGRIEIINKFYDVSTSSILKKLSEC